LPEIEIKLVELAKAAAANAYSPYSKFNVGAAVLLANGEIITGNNQENAAYPSGLCAERVAVFFANAKYPNVPIKTIAVTARQTSGFLETPVPPCGACRQVLLETENRFDSPIKIILAAKEKISILESAKSLLPMSFEKKMLIDINSIEH